jgi:hypothetical protein
MIRLDRREILESLVRQGVRGLSQLKCDCRRFERYWEVFPMGLSNRHGRLATTKNEKVPHLNGLPAKVF